MKESEFINDLSLELSEKINEMIRERDHIRKYESELCKDINKLIKLLEKITGAK